MDRTYHARLAPSLAYLPSGRRDTHAQHRRHAEAQAVLKGRLAFGMDVGIEQAGEQSCSSAVHNGNTGLPVRCDRTDDTTLNENVESGTHPFTVEDPHVGDEERRASSLAPDDSMRRERPENAAKTCDQPKSYSRGFHGCIHRLAYGTHPVNTNRRGNRPQSTCRKTRRRASSMPPKKSHKGHHEVGMREPPRTKTSRSNTGPNITASARRRSTARVRQA
jgi:hypothetical protein